MTSGTALDRHETLARVRARILAFARRLSPADAEDLTQEALVLLTTKYANVAAPEERVALAVEIVRFKRAAYWRKAARRRALGEAEAPSTDDGAADVFELAPGGTPDPEAIARDRLRLAMFVEAAGRLEGRCRQLLHRKLEGANFEARLANGLQDSEPATPQQKSMVCGQLGESGSQRPRLTGCLLAN